MQTQQLQHFEQQAYFITINTTEFKAALNSLAKLAVQRVMLSCAFTAWFEQPLVVS